MARERLILHHLPLVSLVAQRLVRAFPPLLDRQDLTVTGVIGLIEAIDRFDPARRVQFSTFAAYRIRGAMLDEMRALDWVPQSIRAKRRELDRAAATLSPALHRGPTPEELASEIGCSVIDIRERLDAAKKGLVVPLEEVPEFQSEAAVPIEVSDPSHEVLSDEPPRAVEYKEMREALRVAVEALDERDQQVIAMYYLEGFTLARIGEVLGVSESRVSQIHTRIVKALREQLSLFVIDA